MRGRGLLVAATCLAVTAAGCAGGTGTSASDGTTPSPTPSASRSTPSSAEVCANQVRYWSRTLLTEGAYQGGDYQHMGLSDTQNEVLRTLLAEVTPLAQAQGVPAAMAVVDEQAPTRCVAAYASGSPTSAWG